MGTIQESLGQARDLRAATRIPQMATFLFRWCRDQRGRGPHRPLAGPRCEMPRSELELLLRAQRQGGPYQGNMPEGEEARGKVNEASTAHATVSGFNAVQAEIDPERSHAGPNCRPCPGKAEPRSGFNFNTGHAEGMRQDEFGEAGCASVLSGGEQRLRLRLAAAQKIAAVNHPLFTSAGEAAGDQEAEGSGRSREVFCDDGGETCDDALHFTYGQKHGIFAICEVFRDDGGEPRDDALHYKVGIKRDIFVIYEVHIRKTTPRGALAPTTQRLRSILAGCRSSPKAASGRKAEAAAAS